VNTPTLDILAGGQRILSVSTDANASGLETLVNVTACPGTHVTRHSTLAHLKVGDGHYLGRHDRANLSTVTSESLLRVEYDPTQRAPWTVALTTQAGELVEGAAVSFEQGKPGQKREPLALPYSPTAPSAYGLLIEHKSVSSAGAVLYRELFPGEDSIALVVRAVSA